jgi:hypothetical protein
MRGLVKKTINALVHNLKKIILYCTLKSGYNKFPGRRRAVDIGLIVPQLLENTMVN